MKKRRTCPAHSAIGKNLAYRLDDVVMGRVLEGLIVGRPRGWSQPMYRGIWHATGDRVGRAKAVIKWQWNLYRA